MNLRDRLRDWLGLPALEDNVLRAMASQQDAETQRKADHSELMGLLHRRQPERRIPVYDFETGLIAGLDDFKEKGN